jgi:hypothetical protein
MSWDEDKEEKDLPDTHDFRRMRRMQRMRHREKSGPESIAVGLVATIGFGAAFFLMPGNNWWLIFPMVFIGLMPMAAGIAKLFSRKKELPEEQPAPSTASRKGALSKEKEVLHAVSELEGTVTVLQIAKTTSLSIEEAQQTLDDFVKKGFASIEVDSSGRIHYEFQEFKKSSDAPKYLDQ